VAEAAALQRPLAPSLSSGPGPHHLLARVLADDRGAAIIEYALLAGFVALATAPALIAIEASMKATYASWTQAMNACWKMPVPGGGGGC
jgi:Flp pilus assembly pilin Flp